MTRLQALRSFPYNGRFVKRGDVFVAASKSDARILLLSQSAMIAAPPLVPTPDDVITVDPDAEPTPPKRRYRRRDLTAESA